MSWSPALSQPEPSSSPTSSTAPSSRSWCAAKPPTSARPARRRVTPPRWRWTPARSSKPYRSDAIGFREGWRIRHAANVEDSHDGPGGAGVPRRRMRRWRRRKREGHVVGVRCNKSGHLDRGELHLRLRRRPGFANHPLRIRCGRVLHGPFVQPRWKASRANGPRVDSCVRLILTGGGLWVGCEPNPRRPAGKYSILEY
jgi:hypothetical protein